MTGAELYTMANSIVEDTIEETLFYQLLNVAKKKREYMRPWQMLTVLDSSKSVSDGDTYQTAKTLPTNFSRPSRLYVGANLQPYTQVGFEEQHLYRDAARRFFIDIAGGSYYLTGRNQAGTIYFYYIKKTDDIASGTSPVWGDFHELLAFDVASLFQSGIDYDETSNRMSPANRLAAAELERAMIQWDDELKRSAMGDSFSGSGEPALDIGLL